MSKIYKIKRFVLSVIVTTIFSCVSTTSDATINEKVVIDKYSIPESKFIDSKIGIYDKYNNMIPILIKELKQCAPVDKSNVNTLYTDSVIDYGNDLEMNGYSDLDASTVKNEKYWKSIFALTTNDNTALFVRLFVLLRDGYISRAELILLLCYYDENKEWSRDKMILDSVSKDINEITESSNNKIEEGIAKWDNGNRDEALKLYYQSLEIYPKNPWAIYEIAYDYRTENPTLDLDNYYSLIRSFAPLYTLAYQGKMTPQLKLAGKAVMGSVKPAYDNLWQGKDVKINMKILADGYMDMEEFENAIYAYKYLLFHTYNGEFDKDIANKIKICLREINMETVIDYLEDYMAYIVEIKS